MTLTDGILIALMVLFAGLFAITKRQSWSLEARLKEEVKAREELWEGVMPIIKQHLEAVLVTATNPYEPSSFGFMVAHDEQRKALIVLRRTDEILSVILKPKSIFIKLEGEPRPASFSSIGQQLLSITFPRLKDLVFSVKVQDGASNYTYHGGR